MTTFLMGYWIVGFFMGLAYVYNLYEEYEDKRWLVVSACLFAVAWLPVMILVTVRQIKESLDNRHRR